MKYFFSLITLFILTASVSAVESEVVSVFTQKGCSRCEYTIKYLKDHKIEYIEYSTEIESNNAKMWSVIEESGNPEVERLTMPVIVVNGEVSFSIENLEEFLNKISSGR